MHNLIRIATFSNKLALSQADTVATHIRPSGYRTKIETVDGKSKSLSSLEAAILNDTADVFTVPASYVPARLNDSLELIAFTKREIVNDVLLSRKRVSLTAGLRVGTNSPRRVAFLKHFYPKSTVVPVPENLDSRIKKLQAGECALLMSHSDAQRLGLSNLITEQIETSYFVPTAGQASIAVVCHKKLAFAKKEILQRWVNDEETEDCIRTERAFLKTFSRPANIPIFGYAHYEGGLVTLKAGLISANGKHVIKAKRSSTVAECKELGKKVAEEVLLNGGTEILRTI
jgi:hydroxymethylbilane synthase